MANRLKMAVVQAILALDAKGWSHRRIARELHVDRGTVARQVRRARASPNAATAPPGSPAGSNAARAPLGSDPNAASAPLGSWAPNAANAPLGSLAEAGVPPPLAAIGGPATFPSSRPSDCQPLADVILAKLERGLSGRRIHQDLVTEHGFAGSYYSVRRFIRRLGGVQELPPRRVECGPGEEAQVDFGTGAAIVGPDGRRRRPHVFRVVLSHSRKGYSEAVLRQTTEEFLRCLENAFWHFGGVPKVLVIDNLRAAVTKADWYDPELNPKIQSFAAHYGVAILPTRPRTPRHKGKIERGVGYVKGNALKARTFPSLEAENDHLLEWERSVADTRIHGTTRRQVAAVFEQAERAALGPLPRERFPFFHEAQRSVHRDAHVEVQRAYYSVPPEYVGRRVWVRWDARLVRVFNQRFEQIALHVRHDPGRFSTHVEHLAPEKIHPIERGATWLLDKVSGIGPNTARWARAMIEARGIEGVRVLQGLRRLAEQHPSDVLEKACEIAVSYGAYRLRTLRTLVKRSAAKQEQLAFLEEHPIIRPLTEYRVRFHAGSPAGAAAPQGFLRHDSGVRGGRTKEAPDHTSDPGPGTPSAHPRPGYPLSGCVPAEPDSVSPGIWNIAHAAVPFQEPSP